MKLLKDMKTMALRSLNQGVEPNTGLQLTMVRSRPETRLRVRHLMTESTRCP